MNRIAERLPTPRLDLDERDRSLSLGNKIDVAVSAPVTSLEDTPALSPKPALRNFLSRQTELLPLFRHDPKLRPLRAVASSFYCNAYQSIASGFDDDADPIFPDRHYHAYRSSRPTMRSRSSNPT